MLCQAADCSRHLCSEYMNSMISLLSVPEALHWPVTCSSANNCSVGSLPGQQRDGDAALPSWHSPAAERGVNSADHSGLPRAGARLLLSNFPGIRETKQTSVHLSTPQLLTVSRTRAKLKPGACQAAHRAPWPGLSLTASQAAPWQEAGLSP